jgi:DNA-binding HxlR family transcriptional regulator
MRETAQTNCPVQRSAGEIGDKWTFVILRDALNGMKRFTDFKRHLGIASNILSDRLGRLVKDGILELRDAPLGNSHEYHLTQKGRDLHVVLAAIRQWGEKYLFTEGESVTCMVDAKTGEMPAQLELKSVEGALLDPDDLEIVVTRFQHGMTAATV